MAGSPLLTRRRPMPAGGCASRSRRRQCSHICWRCSLLLAFLSTASLRRRQSHFPSTCLSKP
eukprot:1209280-Pyramimonas_sp.AAC.1